MKNKFRFLTYVKLRGRDPDPDPYLDLDPDLDLKRHQNGKSDPCLPKSVKF
jgi:hypothetical protein